MLKLIVLLVVTSTFKISLADITTDDGKTFDSLTQSNEESSEESSSYSSSASYSSSSSSSSSQSQAVDCGPPEIRPPKCTKPNEVLEICPAPCPFRTCGIDDTLIDCIPYPVPGDPDCPPPACRCKPQFFRDDKGNCVPWEKCPVCTNPNEVYDACMAPCPGQSCNVDPRVVRCKAPPKVGDKDCVVGCRCIDDYARNNDGVCIPRKECPPKTPICGLNEEYNPCPDCSPQTCETMNNLYNCPFMPANKTGPGCNPSCRCIKGYFRNKDGECIPASECPTNIPTCGLNEVYDSCPDCSPQTCETMNATYHCPFRSPETGVGCHPSCRCKKGYFRNKNNECILASDCLKCTKPHEYYSCGGACDNVCDTIKEQNQTNCPIINIKCNEMCYCEENYARDYKGDCIPIEECPTCPTNEKYDPCPASLCVPKTCEEAGYPLNCTQREDGAPCPGKPGCVCKDGYLRNKKGICIPSDQCPSCGGDKNATLGCGINCNRHCSNVNQTEPQMCILICYPNSCDCKTDKNGNEYYYDDNLKKCVLPQDCTPQCKQNEVFSECINGGCGKQKCSDINKPVVCINPKVCKSGCICAPGYLRAKNGTCVPSEQCDPPPVCKANEEFSKCGRDGCLKYYCSDLDLPPLCRDTFQCIPQCECKEGYLRASTDNNTCVPVDQCKRQCKANEQYSNCPSGTCQPQTCKEAGYPVPCPIVGPDGQCSGEPGCICISGYLRNDKGICVPKKECPSCGGDKNAVPGCGNHCGNSCSTYNKPVPCPFFCNLNGCDCRDKYVYDNNLRKCVLPEKCTPICQANEEFSSCIEGVGRPQNCADKGKNLPHPDVSKESCTAGCVCKDNYLRAKNGTCIPQDQCQPITCKENEQYSECPAELCQPKTCKQAGFPVPCSFTGPSRGQCAGGPGCICNPGYLRNDKGICVPQNECPSCGGDDNAIPGCGTHCGNTCATYKTKPIACPLICNLNGCDCKKKYVYDGNLRKCVLPKNCTPTCKVNEEYSSCTEGVCRAKNCTDKGKNLPCPDIPEESCTKGCICKEKYLKAKNGTCVPQDQCEPTCPEGEILSNCPPVECEAEYCPKSRDDPQTCPTPKKCGPPRCVCGFNSHRDRKTGKCIATSSCPPFPCDGPNEKYDSCPPVCPGEKCIDFLNNATCPKFRIGIVVPCKPACRCNKGYYRDSKDICICSSKCKDSVCPSVNEEFSTCIEDLCRIQNCADKGKNAPLPANANGSCTTGCVCKKNFLRNKNGTCVPEAQCDQSGC